MTELEKTLAWWKNQVASVRSQNLVSDESLTRMGWCLNKRMFEGEDAQFCDDLEISKVQVFDYLQMLGVPTNERMILCGMTAEQVARRDEELEAFEIGFDLGNPDDVKEWERLKQIGELPREDLDLMIEGYHALLFEGNAEVTEEILRKMSSQSQKLFIESIDTED